MAVYSMTLGMLRCAKSYLQYILAVSEKIYSFILLPAPSLATANVDNPEPIFHLNIYVL